ncbi:hypothetical protein EXN66_Car014167 [Channa argus]|uniref:Uncharacterized protein n=1 Tax=Channa argus TaxID=215402 RepID=A0A6G1Q8J8_CHAAH|nr:hypothetical protein EXN66_Car014167 [Channa argus]
MPKKKKRVRWHQIGVMLGRLSMTSALCGWMNYTKASPSEEIVYIFFSKAIFFPVEVG